MRHLQNSTRSSQYGLLSTSDDSKFMVLILRSYVNLIQCTTRDWLSFWQIVVHILVKISEFYYPTQKKHLGIFQMSQSRGPIS